MYANDIQVLFEQFRGEVTALFDVLQGEAVEELGFDSAQSTNNLKINLDSIEEDHDMAILTFGISCYVVNQQGPLFSIEAEYLTQFHADLYHAYPEEYVINYLQVLIKTLMDNVEAEIDKQANRTLKGGFSRN